MRQKLYHGTSKKLAEGEAFWADPMLFFTDNFEVALFYGAMRAIETVINDDVEPADAEFYIYEFEVEVEPEKVYRFSDQERRWIYTRWISEYMERKDLLEKYQWVEIKHDEIQANRRHNALLEALDMTYGNYEMSVLVEKLFENLPIFSTEFVCIEPKLDFIPTSVYKYNISQLMEDL